MRSLRLTYLLLCSAAVFPAAAQNVAFNNDFTVTGAIESSFLANIEIEKRYESHLNEMLKHYTSASIAASTIFGSEYQKRQALTSLGLWTSSTENIYYHRIYNLVRDGIIPKTIDVAVLCLREPQKAFYWGSYLYEVCNETRQLCHQFQSVVTNGRLGFESIDFIQIADQYVPYLDLTLLSDGRIRNNLEFVSSNLGAITKEDLKADMGTLVTNGRSLLEGTAENVSEMLLPRKLVQNLLNGDITALPSIIRNYADSYESLYSITRRRGLIGLLNVATPEEAMEKLFSVSSYNSTSWLNNYVSHSNGEYYTQTWYIRKKTSGTDVLLDYTPTILQPIIYNSDHFADSFPSSEWTYFINQKTFSSSDLQKIKKLSSSASGLSALRYPKDVSGANFSETHAISTDYTLQRYIFEGNVVRQYSVILTMGAYAIRVTDNWTRTETLEQHVFNSYDMDMAAFTQKLHAYLGSYRDYGDVDAASLAPGHEDAFSVYSKGAASTMEFVIEAGEPQFYTVPSEKEIESFDFATITATCHDHYPLDEGGYTYYCGDCTDKITAHTRECSMLDYATDIDEISNAQAFAAELQRNIRDLENDIDNLKTRVQSYTRLIARATPEKAEQYRQRLAEVQSQLAAAQSELAEFQDAYNKVQLVLADLYEEADENTISNHIRIPAIMRDVQTRNRVTWTDAGKWVSDDTFVRTGSVYGRAEVITFTAKISVAKKPVYFFGRLLKCARIRINWDLTTDISSTSVLKTIDLRGKTAAQRDKLILDEYTKAVLALNDSRDGMVLADCSLDLEYTRSPDAVDDDTEDTYHLLWASDRLRIAREIEGRLVKIYASLVTMERMMSFRLSVKDILGSFAPLDLSSCNKPSIAERAMQRWSDAAGAVRIETKYVPDEK